jgi:hypothetical protein
LQDAAEGYTGRDIKISRFNALQTSSNYSLAGRTAMKQGNAAALAGLTAGSAAAANLRTSGSMAAAAGYVKGVTSFFQAATIADKLYGGNSTPNVYLNADGTPSPVSF